MGNGIWPGQSNHHYLYPLTVANRDGGSGTATHCDYHQSARHCIDYYYDCDHTILYSTPRDYAHDPSILYSTPSDYDYDHVIPYQVTTDSMTINATVAL